MIESLLDDIWLNKLANYRKLIVGFSGGLDSTVLLHFLALQSRFAGQLMAVHVNHGLSVNADAWQTHCQQVCQTFGIPISTHQVAFDKHANIEENARIARYQVFYSQLGNDDCLLLAHHCDDQAETVLLQLMRGAGIDGLAAMVAMKTLARGELARPLLQHSRHRLEVYARQHNLVWIEDESNQNNAFSRNYIRNQIMPLLRDKWPGATKNLAACAAHCQQASINLDFLAALDCEGMDLNNNTLLLSSLQNLSHSRLTNVLRSWIKNNLARLPSAKTFNRLIDEVILASDDAKPCVQWGETIVKRYRQSLYLLPKSVNLIQKNIEWINFPEPLPLSQGGAYLHASLIDQGLQVPAGSHVQVCFRQGGELLRWRGQTKTLKKLLQQWHVPPWLRDAIPLIYIDQCLAVVVGYAISDYFYNSKGFNQSYHIDFIPRLNDE